MNHLRHSAIFDATQYPVAIIGAGGIGAMTALVLGKMGVPDIYLFDPDYVEDENLATQFHSKIMLESLKVFSVATDLIKYTDARPHQYPVRVDASTEVDELINCPIIISAVDSIEARKDIWKLLEKGHWFHYLDSSMAAEKFVLRYTFWKRSDLYSNYITSVNASDIPPDPCTSKATFYTAAIAAGHIGAAVRSIVTSESPPDILSHDIYEQSLITVGGKS